ncbi:hypothetical protein niasHT_033950 [Heterodera trifolii]|uniref:VQ domain-containing protein n=1 Tax=Heterodera trifolii TaxID=157864 RepID=A0ABD2HU69_9BILA
MGQNGINNNNNNNNILDKFSTQSALLNDFNSYFNNLTQNLHTFDDLVTNNGNNFDEMGQNGISNNNENGPGNNLDSNLIDLTSNLDTIGTLATTNIGTNSGQNPNGINGALKIGTSRSRNRMPSRAPSSSAGPLKRKRSLRRDPSRHTTTIHVDKQNFRQAVQEATGGPFKPSMMQNMKNLLPQPHGLFPLTLPGTRTPGKQLMDYGQTFLREAAATPPTHINEPSSSTAAAYRPAAAMSLNDAFLIPKQGESSKMGKKPSLREAFMMPPTKMVMPTSLLPNEMPMSNYFVPNEMQMPIQSVPLEQTPNQFVPTEMPMPTHFVPNQMQVPVQIVPIEQTPNQFVPYGVQMPTNETQMLTQSVSAEMTMPMKSVSSEMQMPTPSMPVETPFPTESVSSEMPFMLDEAALRYGGTLESLVWPMNSQIGQQFINVDKDHWETIPNSPNLKRTKTLSSADHDERQGQKWPIAIQNAKIYLNIYKIAANYLLVDPSNKAVIKSMTNGAQVWELIKNFIDQSVAQLEALINQWTVAKVHPFCDEQLEMQAINKYIMAHCPKTDQ